MLKVALDSFSLAHEAWVRMARARVFKRKETNNNKHGGETFIASRVLLTAIFFVPKKEWRAKRKLEFQGMVEDWSPPKKRETRLSQVWFKSCFRYTWHQAIHLKF